MCWRAAAVQRAAQDKSISSGGGRLSAVAGAGATTCAVSMHAHPCLHCHPPLTPLCLMMHMGITAEVVTLGSYCIRGQRACHIADVYFPPRSKRLWSPFLWQSAPVKCCFIINLLNLKQNAEGVPCCWSALFAPPARDCGPRRPPDGGRGHGANTACAPSGAPGAGRSDCQW
jgi:hypothetical protein